jgi:hypothetical protein
VQAKEVGLVVVFGTCLIGGYFYREHKKRGPDPAPSLTAATAEEAEAFGRGLVAEHKKCATSPHDVNSLIDTESLVYRTLDGLELKPEEKRGFVDGARGTAAKFLCNHIGEATLKLLRVRSVGGEHHPIFRALHDDGAIGYLEMVVAKREGASPRAVDVYLFTTGEWLSKSLTDITNSLDRESAEALSEVAKLVRSAREKSEWKAVLQAIDNLPVKVRATKAMQSARVQAASNIGDEEYSTVLAEFEAKFPNDPSLDLIAIDAYMLRKQLDKIPPLYARLSERTGGDAHLDAQLAMILLELKQPEKALAAAKKATAAEPELKVAWEQLGAAQARTADFDGVLATQRELKRRFDVWFGEDNKDFDAFHASPQGKTWLAEVQAN